MSTAWQLMIIGLVICIGLPFMQRIIGPAFGFERRTEGFATVLTIWILLGGFLFTTGLLMKVFGNTGQGHHH